MQIKDLPGYKPISKIHKGGMTDLWIATSGSGDKVVVRFIKDAFARDRSIRKNFIHGMEVLETLEHPNIVRIIECGHHLGQPFMVEEYHKNNNLRECITQRDKLLASHQFTFVRELASALSYIHARGYLHMDIKPENILIRPDTGLVLVDFDLAIKLRGKPIRIKKLPGTPAYLSPETLRERVIDERSEVYSFGVVAYEMLTLHKPFESNSMAEYQRAVVNPHVRPFNLRHYAQDISLPLEEIILRCLAKDPELRYPSMSIVLRDLESML